MPAIYTQMGFESEAGTWRNIYLTGAQELRDGVGQLPPPAMSLDVLAATTTLDAARFRRRARQSGQGARRAFKINIELTDRNEKHLITVANGVLIHETGVSDSEAGLSIRLKRPELLALLMAGAPIAGRIKSGDISAEGDAALFDTLAGLIEPFTPNFPIVTP